MKSWLTLPRLRELHPGACETDLRVVLDTETGQLFVAKKGGTSGPLPLDACGTRDLRLLARQLEWFAEFLDRMNQRGELEEARWW